MIAKRLPYSEIERNERIFNALYFFGGGLN